MSRTAKVVTALAIVLVLGGLAAADAGFTHMQLTASLMEKIGKLRPDGEGVRRIAKSNGRPVPESILAAGIEPREMPTEASLLAQIVEDGQLQTRVLFQDGDRAGFIAWTDTGDAKAQFAALKEALLLSFSHAVRDLKDETIMEPGHPVVSLLSFHDDKLSPEDFVILRVRDVLIELHVPAGKVAAMQKLVDELVK